MGRSPNTVLDTHTQFIFVFTLSIEWFYFTFLIVQFLKLIILRWDAAQGFFVIILLNFDLFLFIKLIRQCMFVAYILC